MRKRFSLKEKSNTADDNFKLSVELGCDKKFSSTFQPIYLLFVQITKSSKSWCLSVATISLHLRVRSLLPHWQGTFLAYNLKYNPNCRIISFKKQKQGMKENFSILVSKKHWCFKCQVKLKLFWNLSILLFRHNIIIIRKTVILYFR